MTKSLYNLYLFCRYELLQIMKILTNDILILADNNFTIIEKEGIKLVKIMTKDKKYLILTQPLKLNSAQIKFD